MEEQAAEAKDDVAKLRTQVQNLMVQVDTLQVRAEAADAATAELAAYRNRLVTRLVDGSPLASAWRAIRRRVPK